MFETYTRDLSREDLQRLFTHDTRDAYRFFTRGLDEEQIARLPWWKQAAVRVPPGLRRLHAEAAAGAARALPGRAGRCAARPDQAVPRLRGRSTFPFGTAVLPGRDPRCRSWADGTFALLLSLLLVNLLVLLEVADRLSLKGELEVAREIQLAMLPSGTYTSGDIEICGMTRPANTVGGDFYDVLPLPDGRVILAARRRGRQGQPGGAADGAAAGDAAHARRRAAGAGPRWSRRLNTQICRHSPGSRFITLFYGVYTPATGALTYVNAGQNPPLLRRADGSYERLGATGIALGMFEGSTLHVGRDAGSSPARCSCSTATASPKRRIPRGSRSKKPGCEAILDSHPDDSPAGARHAHPQGGRALRAGVAVHRRPDDPDPQAARAHLKP